MKILVALKQVPDTETKIKLGPDGRSIDPADVKWITSPYDEYALEEAIRLKESKAAEVTVVSLGGGCQILGVPINSGSTQKSP